jgi:hypothetical protein
VLARVGVGVVPAHFPSFLSVRFFFFLSRGSVFWGLFLGVVCCGVACSGSGLAGGELIKGWLG